MNYLTSKSVPQIARVRALYLESGDKGLLLAAEETILSWYVEGEITAEERDHLFQVLHKPTESPSQ